MSMGPRYLFTPAPTGLDVVVAPQMSFGTGHHATTHLMSTCLMDESLNSKAVLDMGCGTELALVEPSRSNTRTRH